jgi:proteasome lid subunit RPN8/RPN11
MSDAQRQRAKSEADRAPDLLLKPAAQADCERALAAAHPREACALLLGRKTPKEHLVRRIALVPNIAAGDDAYELDPLTWREVELEARAEGLEVVGVWHSHPRTQAAPSARDRAAAQPGWSHAITAAADPTRTRSYYARADGLVEQRVSTCASLA